MKLYYELRNTKLLCSFIHTKLLMFRCNYQAHGNVLFIVILVKLYIDLVNWSTATWLAQLEECRSAKQEVAG